MCSRVLSENARLSSGDTGTAIFGHLPDALEHHVPFDLQQRCVLSCNDFDMALNAPCADAQTR